MVVADRRAHLHHHDGLAAFTQGVLQQIRESRVPEGDVSLPSPKSLNDVAQRQQGAVDVLGLFQPLSLGAGLPDPL